MIVIKDLTFSYGKNLVFDNYSLEIPSGTVFLRGSNGCGKSTLLSLIMGIIKPKTGTIHSTDGSLGHKKLSHRARDNGFLYQNPDVMLFANTVYDELAFPLQLKGLEEEEIDTRVRDVMQQFRLMPYKDCFPLKLSQGLKQRLALSCICIQEPKRLLLDEPTSRLDVRSKGALVELLKGMQEDNIDLIIATHDDELQERLQGHTIQMSRL